jgi:hypothetical protein
LAPHRFLLFIGKEGVPEFSYMYFIVFSVLFQYLAIQPADCGHENKFWSTVVRRATLRTVSLIAWGIEASGWRWITGTVDYEG